MKTLIISNIVFLSLFSSCNVFTLVGAQSDIAPNFFASRYSNPPTPQSAYTSDIMNYCNNGVTVTGGYLTGTQKVEVVDFSSDTVYLTLYPANFTTHSELEKTFPLAANFNTNSSTNIGVVIYAENDGKIKPGSNFGCMI